MEGKKKGLALLQTGESLTRLEKLLNLGAEQGFLGSSLEPHFETKIFQFHGESSEGSEKINHYQEIIDSPLCF